MNDRLKTFIYENFIILLCIVTVFVGGVLYLCCKRTPANNNVAPTIQQIEQNLDGAGASIKQAQDQNRAASNSIERANASIRNSQERVRELQTELRLINAELSRCYELNIEAQNELKSIKSQSK